MPMKCVVRVNANFVKPLLTGVDIRLWSSTQLLNLQETGPQFVDSPFTQLGKLHLQNDAITRRNQTNVRQTVSKHGPAVTYTYT